MLLYLLIGLLVVELVLIVTVRLQRKSFPWLITEEDECPNLSLEVVQNFLDKSHDPVLGWVRRPGTEGVERGQRGSVTYHIDATGARLIESNHVPLVAAFGDSFVFCRQVEDNETWEAQWSAKAGIGVLNFGVGNYGVDQALIRYEQTVLPNTVRYAVLGFVPETICRIQSVWKHYLEFGNTLAFKPRFCIDDQGGLRLIDNVIRKKEDFFSLSAWLPYLKQHDVFYQRKFRSVQFRFPYLASFLRHPFRHASIMTAVGVRSVVRVFRGRNSVLETVPFSLLMRQNIKDAHSMYLDAEARTLLTEILKRFVATARLRGHEPLILVMPQLLDLKLAGKGATYCDYFERLGEELPVLDLTSALMDTEFECCYVNDQYGGHFSARGNQMVADALSRHFSI